MEICQHCEMYMKPFKGIDEGIPVAMCEFCGEVIARVVNKKWVKLTPSPYKGSEVIYQ